MQEKRPWIVTFGPWIGAILVYIVISQAVGYITDTKSQMRREAREQQTAEFLAGEAQDEVDADATPAGTEVDLGEEVVEEADLEDETVEDEATQDEATQDEPANGEPAEGDTAADDTATDEAANGEEPDSGDAESEDVNDEETDSEEADGEETEADAS